MQAIEFPLSRKERAGRCRPRPFACRYLTTTVYPNCPCCPGSGSGSSGSRPPPPPCSQAPQQNLHMTIDCPGCGCPTSLVLNWGGVGSNTWSNFSLNCTSVNNGVQLTCSGDVWSLFFFTSLCVTPTAPVLTSWSTSPFMLVFSFDSCYLCSVGGNTCTATITI